MKRVVNLRNYARLIFVAAVIMVMVSGVTFAALKSQGSVVRGNLIQTASASLQLSKDNHDFYNSIDGFYFVNIIPGISPSASHQVYMRNGGTTNLALTASIATPIATQSGIDLSKVYLVLTPQGAGAQQKISFEELIASHASGGVPLTYGYAAKLGPNNSIGYNLQVAMDQDAVNSDAAQLENVDITFGGASVN